MELVISKQNFARGLERLPGQTLLAVQHCAEVRSRYAQHRPAAAGILPDKTVIGPERTVPAHGRRALAEPQG